ncbi:MAG: hypothetical protein F4216_10120 [Acidimicrobiaceae bacterium]|nr:hypothetical protein [Acidimicrobiaceae bacterium]
MPTDRAETMRGIRTFAQVFQYLVDDQGWPIELPDLEDDDLTAVTYDWDPDELGIPAEQLKDLSRLQQMRPLTANQPWGVFFLEFRGPRLRYGPIRRLLRALVTKKRSAGTGSTRTWALDALLFIVITGTGDDVELHVLAFKGSDPQTAEFRSLAWRPAHAPTLHLQRLSEELLPCLAWPDDDSDAESWRKAWWEAFKLPVGQAIKDSARLADRMAKTAGDLRTQIREALDRENGSGPFSTLMSEIRTQLVSDVNADSFADMCAQTLVYGMLSSRVTNPKDFGSSPIFSAVPVANPFLEALFEQVHDEAVSLDLPGSDLPHLVADLRETNVEAILDQIGSTAKGGDPVIHFYEEFLKRYDSKKRLDAGAFYTPQHAVEFMVRAVDEVLRSRFGLPMGIADPSTWQEVADHKGFDVPKGVDCDKPFVSMIDPATGTGTFLVAWLRQSRQSFLMHGAPDEWSEHLRDRLLPSMHAFELMLAPYAIAHLKVALELHAVGAGDGTMQILLTDTLEHVARQGQLATMTDPVAEEGERAAILKQKQRFTIVIGNPPYDLEQRVSGDTGRRKGGVVRHGVSGIPPLFNAVAEPMKAANLGGNLTKAYNDYVYFWRWAVWQATELPPGPGIVAFITASSYLDGKAMGGVRYMLRRAFDELWILDVGGESRGARTDENIFDIRIPVAIAVGICSGQPGSDECIVRYRRIEGTRDEKLDQLSKVLLEDASEVVIGSDLDRFTPRSDSSYYGWPRITDLFPWIHSGCLTARTWPVGETKALLSRRWRALLDEIPRNRAPLFKETTTEAKDRTIATAPLPLLGAGARLRPLRELDFDDLPEGIERYGFRTFDRHWLIADNRLADRPRPVLWRVRGPSQVFLTTMTSSKLGQGLAVSATPYTPDYHHFAERGAKDVMPLYRDSDGQSPNITDGLLAEWSQLLDTEVSAEDMLAYVYGLCGTSAFGQRFDDELAEGAGPIHIPITASHTLFEQVSTLGRDLLWWHTWGDRFAPDGESQLPNGQAVEVRRVEGMPDDFDYDSASQTLTVGTGAFSPVSQEAWDFEVSGLRVLSSWLSYRMKTRKGRKSSPLDDIRPTRWTQSNELLLVLSIIEHTIEVTPKATDLLAQIVDGPLIPATDLPTPTPANCKPPRP